MENRKDIRKSILNEPSYWVEKLNIDLYDALITYQEKNNLKKKDLAAYLEISSARLSQILNDGDSNFNTSTLVSILLKLGKYPQIDFLDQALFLTTEAQSKKKIKELIIELNVANDFFQPKKQIGRPKIIQLHSTNLRHDVKQSLGGFCYELQEKYK